MTLPIISPISGRAMSLFIFYFCFALCLDPALGEFSPPEFTKSTDNVVVIAEFDAFFQPIEDYSRLTPQDPPPEWLGVLTEAIRSFLEFLLQEADRVLLLTTGEASWVRNMSAQYLPQLKGLFEQCDVVSTFRDEQDVRLKYLKMRLQSGAVHYVPHIHGAVMAALSTPKPRTQLLCVVDGGDKLDACFRAVDYVRSTQGVPQLYAKSILMNKVTDPAEVTKQLREVGEGLYGDVLREKSEFGGSCV